MSEAPKVSLYEASTCGEVTVLQNWSQVIEVVRSTSAASGSSTTRLMESSVMPSVRPKPGSTRWEREVMARPVPGCVGEPAAPRASRAGLVDPVEQAAVVEVLLLRLLPAAEDLVDGEEL